MNNLCVHQRLLVAHKRQHFLVFSTNRADFRIVLFNISFCRAFTRLLLSNAMISVILNCASSVNAASALLTLLVSIAAQPCLQKDCRARASFAYISRTFRLRGRASRCREWPIISFVAEALKSNLKSSSTSHRYGSSFSTYGSRSRAFVCAHSEPTPRLTPPCGSDLWSLSKRPMTGLSSAGNIVTI